MRIEIPIIAEDESLLPVYASEDAAGADVKANLSDPVIIPSGQSRLIPTGLRFEIPSGFEIQVRPRSGLALKHQISIPNSPGTIDADYRGEVGVILINHGREDFVVLPGMRIAQIILAPVAKALFIHREELSTTARSGGGFGHTGVN